MAKRTVRAGASAPAISTTAITILALKVGGEREETYHQGQMVKVGNGVQQVTQEIAEMMVSKGIAAWVGDKESIATAGDKQRQQAAKSAAESTMQRYDQMTPEERAEMQERDSEEGSDVT